MTNEQHALESVEQVGSMKLVGHIIPHAWYKRLTMPNGKPYWAAIHILADVMYWYRPNTQKGAGPRHGTIALKKFAGHKLRKSLGEFAAQLILSRCQVAAALAYLEGRGLVTMEVRPREEIGGSA